jgi:5'-nucleotidase
MAAALVAVACAAVPLAQTAVRPGPAMLTIVHFSDVHELGAAEGGRVGGVARIATLVEGLRRSSPPVLVTLGGDFLSPSPLGTARVDGEPLAGRQAVAVLNTLGVQWATLGNHEFDVTEAAFRARVAEAKFRLVSSNVTDASGQPFQGVAPSAVVPIVIGGRTKRIGIIGLTIDMNRKPWVQYLPAVDAARLQAVALKDRTDALVALTHQSLAADIAVATAVPEIDLILGGHEHENWLVRRGAGFTPIVKADGNGRSAAIVTLTFGPAGTRPAVAARLQAMDATVLPHAEVQDELARWTRLAFDAFRQDGFTPEATIARVTEPLDGRESTVRNRAGALTDLIGAAMLREVGQADGAILNGGSVRVDDVIAPGPVTQYDVLRMLPFGGKVLKATFEGSLLRQVLDIGLSNQGSGGYLHTAGMSRPGSAWLVQGQPLDPGRKYTVAISEFLLTGGERGLGFLTRANPQVSDVQEFRDVRQALVDELKARHGGGAPLGFFSHRLERVAGFFRE